MTTTTSLCRATPDDIKRLGLTIDQPVRVKSSTGEMRYQRVRAFDVRPGNAMMYCPEANVLVPVGSRAKGSNTPASKMVPVTVERATSAVDVVGTDERLVYRDAAAQAEQLTGAAV